MAKAIKNENINEEILHFLRQEEMDYPAAAKKFGAAALPFLNELINGNDEKLARNAAYLAGYIGSPKSKAVLENAATNKFTTVRIAAAYGAASQDATAAKSILSKSLNDDDHGVIKVAMRSIGEKGLQKSFTKEIQAVQKKSLPTEIKNQAKSLGGQ